MTPLPCRVLTLATFLSAALAAQIEPGWGVLGSARNPGQGTFPGIWTFDPVNGNFTQLPTPGSSFDMYAQVFALQSGVWQGSSGLSIHVF